MNAIKTRGSTVQTRRKVPWVGGLVLMNPVPRERFMVAWRGVGHLTHVTLERKSPSTEKRFVEAAP
jgi:hypothetical protein